MLELGDKGGLRYHPTMDEGHAAALANLMTWKTAVVEAALGRAPLKTELPFSVRALAAGPPSARSELALVL